MAGASGFTTGSLDALPPAEVARKAESVGVTKAGMPAVDLFALAVLAGAFIALGAAFATTVASGSDLPYGVTRLLAGLAFTLGLILVVVAGAELFTGNNLIVMARASGRIGTLALLRNWTIVYAGNFVGAFGTAVLVWLGKQYTFGGGVVGTTALTVAEGKVSLGFGQAVAMTAMSATLFAGLTLIWVLDRPFNNRGAEITPSRMAASLTIMSHEANLPATIPCNADGNPT